MKRKVSPTVLNRSEFLAKRIELKPDFERFCDRKTDVAGLATFRASCEQASNYEPLILLPSARSRGRRFGVGTNSRILRLIGDAFLLR